MLVERPEMLEADLSIYKSEKGTPLGAGYTSGVGEIDLLARDRAGDLVVVMVAEPHEGADIISVMLQRIGWVRKHLSRNAKPVRGIVLLDAMPEDLAYAASAVSGTINFKTYRVALAFEDIAL
jgi:RecB family endonuclease NucS